MKAELTFFVMTSSEGKGSAKAWNLKPGDVWTRRESGFWDACATWMMVCGDEPCELVVEETRDR